MMSAQLWWGFTVGICVSAVVACVIAADETIFSPKVEEIQPPFGHWIDIGKAPNGATCWGWAPSTSLSRAYIVGITCEPPGKPPPSPPAFFPDASG